MHYHELVHLTMLQFSIYCRRILWCRYRETILKSRTIKVNSYPCHVSVSKRKTEVVNPPTPFCYKGEEEEEEEAREEENMQEKNYTPCLDDKE